MTHPLKYILGLFCVALLSFNPFPAFAQFHYQLTPGISVSETYDDNIDFTPTNEESDYITGLTPNINFDILTERTNLAFNYAPTFVFYKNNKQNNTTRHLTSLTWGQELSRYLKFKLTDTYYQSEEPIEYSDLVLGVRTSRQTYRRNEGQASIGILFGPENTLNFGYSHRYLENEDPTIEDGKIQRPFASLGYWFNVKNGVQFKYEYLDANFSRDVGDEPDDYKGQAAGGRYIYRFSPHTKAYLGYDFTTRDFTIAEDFDVHEVSVGFDHAFSPDLDVSLAVGYFLQDSVVSPDESGYPYYALLTKRFERGTFTIGGTGGWDFYGDYIDPQNRGFTKYYSGNARFEYEVAEPFSLYVGGFYRLDRDTSGREWDLWRGNAGISLSFLRYLALSLDYRHAQRDDDDDAFDYKNNRVMLRLTASKLYRW
jgi:hypothetical protein